MPGARLEYAACHVDLLEYKLLYSSADVQSRIEFQLIWQRSETRILPVPAKGHSQCSNRDWFHQKTRVNVSMCHLQHRRVEFGSSDVDPRLFVTKFPDSSAINKRWCDIMACNQHDAVMSADFVGGAALTGCNGF